MAFLNNLVSNFGMWAPLIFIIVYSAATLFLPATPFIIVAGFLFGLFHGFIYASLGALIGSVAAFLISRRLGKVHFKKILSQKHFKFLDKYNRKLSEGGLRNFIIIKSLPGMPANVFNYLMGLSDLKFKNFLLGTLIGLIPSHLATIYFSRTAFRIL